MAERNVPQCEVNVAKTWTDPVQECPNDAAGLITIGADEFWVCAEHGGAR